MFSNRAHLKRKTPENGIERKEFISLLVDEYYETTDIGMKFVLLVYSTKQLTKN